MVSVKKEYTKYDSNSLSKCVTCHRTYTLHMMIQINHWADRYRCVKCFNVVKQRTGLVDRV